MKRRRGPKKKGKKIIAVESEDNEESEDAVEAIVGFKPSKLQGAGGYLLHVKWVGYKENDNTWEPMKVLLDGWDCGDNDVYEFFEKENIDVSRCSEFDFKERTRKPRQVKIAKKSQVQKDNLNAKTTTAEGQKDISNEVDSANKNQGKRDYDDGGFICDSAHSPNDLKLEENAAYAKKNNFLYEKRCKKCSKMFVDKHCVEKKDKEYVIGCRTPCYICYNEYCTYYICGQCHKQDLVNGSTNGRSSIRNKLNN